MREPTKKRKASNVVVGKVQGLDDFLKAYPDAFVSALATELKKKAPEDQRRWCAEWVSNDLIAAVLLEAHGSELV